MSEDGKNQAGSGDGFATVVSWAVIIAGVIVVLGAGGCILVSLPNDGGLAMLLGGHPCCSVLARSTLPGNC